MDRNPRLQKGTTSHTLFPSPNSAQRASDTGGIQRQRQKIRLKPGHSPLDWAELNRKTERHILRGCPPQAPPAPYVRVSIDELRKHRTREDCWTCINGKVFNLTPYIDFHPGGALQLMRCAGKDGTDLFNKYHSWVSVDRMLENCLVGIMS